MNYERPLFGKIGRRLVPLKMTSKDVDAMAAKIASLEMLLTTIQGVACIECSRTTGLRREAWQAVFDAIKQQSKQ